MFQKMIKGLNDISNALAPCEQEYQELLEAYEGSLRQSGSFLRISKMYSFCPHREGLLLTTDTKERQRQPESLLVMDYGTALHRVWQKIYIPSLAEGVYCKKCNNPIQLPSRQHNCPYCNCPLYFKEQKVTDTDSGISGHPDGVLIDENGLRVLLEIKTVEEDKYIAYTIPTQEHIYQASIYAALTDCQYIKLVVVNRNGSVRKKSMKKFFELQPDKSAIVDMRKKAVNYYKFLQDVDPRNVPQVLDKLIKNKYCVAQYDPPAVYCECKKLCFA